MTIIVNSKSLKTFHARSGSNNVFGRDVDDRKRMNETQLIERFDQVWKNTLCRAVEMAQSIETEDARKLLEPKLQSFFKGDQEHREFWLEGGLFLAQLNPIDETTRELTQLWFIRSSNVDPRTLFVTFDTVDLREDFHQVAEKLGYTDEDLGKKLLMDFMQTVQNKAAQH